MTQQVMQDWATDPAALTVAWKQAFDVEFMDDGLRRNLAAARFTVADVRRIADLAHDYYGDRQTGLGEFAADYRSAESLASEFCGLVRHWSWTCGVTPTVAVPFLALAEWLPRKEVWAMVSASNPNSMSGDVIGWLGLAGIDEVDPDRIGDVGPLAVAAGLSAAEVVARQAAGTLDEAALRALAALRGFRLTGLRVG